MLLLAYRTLPPEQSLPVDQRWRTFEVDPGVFAPTGSDAGDLITQINEGDIPNVQPIPPGSIVYLVDTDTLESWALDLSVTKT
jgi:hypothetical protein